MGKDRRKKKDNTSSVRNSGISGVGFLSRNGEYSKEWDFKLR